MAAAYSVLYGTSNISYFLPTEYHGGLRGYACDILWGGYVTRNGMEEGRSDRRHKQRVKNGGTDVSSSLVV